MEHQKTSIPPSDLLTAEEVSDQLRLPLSTVYHLAKTGELPAFRVGRSWRFSAQEIKRLVGASNGRPRILVVDDDQVTRALVVAALEPRDCLVVQASRVAEALEVTRRQRFDVLLIDLKMPGGNGTELIRQLQGDYSLSQMVMITGFPDLAQMNNLLDLGALTLLRKPFSVGQLGDCVERIIGRSLPQEMPLHDPAASRPSNPFPLPS